MPADPLTIAAAGAWARDKYGKAVTDKAADTIKSRWHKFGWGDAVKKYRAKVKKLYGTMQIMGMAEPVQLEDIFTDAYMLDRPTALGRFDIERLKELPADASTLPHAQRVNGLRLVVEKDFNLLILGRPGAGKTTFLKYIAVKAAEQTIDKVPVFVSLKEWADSGKDLLPFIADERFDICAFPDAQPFVEELLKSGEAIVLFDGLDEVSQESGQRDKQARALSNFIEKYDTTQCLVTCRVAASDYYFEKFAYVEVADFTEAQIRTFVGNWFRNQEGERDEETRKRFLADFNKEENRGLRDLSRTPLLLTLLCLAYSVTGTFPRRRADIYQEGLDALLRKWDSSRRIRRDEIYRNLSLGQKTSLVARIAAEMFERNEYFIPQSRLERLIGSFVKNIPPHDAGEASDGEAILKAIEAQHGVLVERARGIYSFSHLTFQEYFVAKYIVANEAQGALSNLVRGHCADERWREVFLLTTSLLPDGGQLIGPFRRAVDELLAGDERLWELLTWADKKTGASQPDAWLVRPGYLLVTFYCEGITIDLYDVLYGALQRDRAGLLAQHPDLLLDSALACDHDLPTAAGYARAIGLGDLADELTALATLSSEATAEEWQEHDVKLRDLMLKHRDLGHRWELTPEQRARLVSYLKATTLLQDCLELAFMPPEGKEAVLNSLYLPPARPGEE